MKRSLGQKFFFFAIFGTFGRYITNLRGTLFENVKKSRKSTHPNAHMFLVSFDRPEVATPYETCSFAFCPEFSPSPVTKGKILFVLFLQRNINAFA
jgi:hypothetical protein